MKPINWLNIAIHAAVALPMGAVPGAVLHLGLAYGGVLGNALAVLGAAGGLGAALYWLARERLQHSRAWGGLQSQLELGFPVIAVLLGAAAGWWASNLLL